MATFAEALVNQLADFGVRYVFGIPSGPWTLFMEAMRRSGKMDFVLVSNEASGAFMADVCWRLTGKLAACYGTFGPGATNLSTGVVNAFLDRSPLIAFTTQAPTAMRDRVMQMKIDHQALFRPITKWTTELSAANLHETLVRAFELATAEPPGPLHLGIPAELGDLPVRTATSNQAPKTTFPGVAPEAAMQQVVDLLAAARKPIVAVGLGATRANAQAQLRAFIEKQRIPVVLTPMAKGLISEESPCYAGVLFHALSNHVAQTYSEADLVVAVGYDPVEFNYEDWVPDVPIVYIDSVGTDVHPRYTVYEIFGDLRHTLTTLAGLPRYENVWDIEAVQRRKAKMFDALSPDTASFSPHHALNILRELLPKDGIMTCDVGAHTHLIGQLWKTYNYGNLMMTNGGSSMGFGVPSAIAAKLCCPERQVACVTGDGGFLMMVGEMVTARNLGLPVVFVVLVDSNLQLIKIKQERKGYPQYGTKLLNIPYPPPEHYFGVPVLSARNANEYRVALIRAFDMNSPVVVEAHIDPSVYDELILKPHCIERA